MSEDGKLLDDIGGLESAIARLEASFKKLTDSASSFTTTMRGGMNGFVSAGTGNTGSAGPNVLSGSLSSIAPGLLRSGRMGMAWGIAGGVTQMLGGVAAGTMAALPDVQKSLGMASGEFHAGMLSGTNWRKVGSATFSYLKGGMNMEGAQGIVAAQLSGAGVQFGGQARGLAGGAGMYQSISRSVAGAARLLNVQNDQAAQSFTGMYRGSTSMGLLQNFGIYTTDPNSGQSATPTQIYAMLNDRLTGGGKMSYKQLQTSLGPGGMMTANIENSGLDATGQQMLRAYMLSASKGKYLNFDNPNSKDTKSVLKAAGSNPMQAQMDVTGANNQTMQAAVTSYVAGMNKAKDAVVAFQKTLTNFLHSPMGKLFAGSAGALNLAGQSTMMQGLATGTAGLLGGAMNIGGAVLGYKGLKSILGKGAADTAGKVGGKVLGKSLGKIIPGVGAVLAGVDGWSDSANKGDFWGGMAMAAGTGAIGGGIAGAFAGGVGALPGAGIGALVGGAGYALGYGANQLFGSGGQPSTVATGGFGSNNGVFKLSRPVKQGKITSRYMDRTGPYHSNGHHGMDFGVSEGTAVQAAAAGTVSSTAFENGYGQTVRIDHGKGYVTLYAHLSSASVRQGDQVQAGQLIGYSGNTGAWTTGPHLHFGLYLNGAPQNPEPLLGGSVGFVSATDTSGNDPNIRPTTGSGSGQPGAYYQGAEASSAGYSVGTASSSAIPASYSGASIGSSAAYKSVKPGAGIGRAANRGSAGTGNDNTGGGAPGGGNVNHFNIEVKVASASEAEARKFAQMIKGYIEQDTLLTNMGRM
jgi:hypothetical protein